MQKERRFQFLLLPLIAACGLLLLFAVFQLSALEERVIVQSQQLRALGEKTEKMSGELKRISAGGLAGTPTPARDDYAGVNLLHPEVPNFLSGKSKRWPVEGVPTDGVLNRGWPSGDPKGLNWMLENSADVMYQLQNYIVSPLARRNRWDDPSTWYGDLAFHVEITDDFKEYTFYLRRGVMWHPVSGIDLNSPKYSWLDKPHEFTADDMVFAFEMLLSPQVENGAAKSYFQDVESYKAIDDYTFVVRWKKKTYQSLEQTLSMAPLPRFLYGHAEDGTPYPKETLGVRFNQHWYNNKGMIGHGPYRLETYEPGVKIELVRNEEFYGDKPAIKRLSYPIYTDSKQTVLKLKSGELNFGSLQPGQYREEVLAWKDKPANERPKNNPFVNGKLTCETSDYPAFSYIGWNADKPLFADPKVRTAMTLALDRKRLVETVFAGLGSVAYGPYLPSSGHLDPEIRPLPFDLDRARSLLKEAGWTDTDGDGLLDKELDGRRTPFEFTLLIYGGSSEYTSLANIFKEDLLKLGIKMKIEAAEWSLMQKRMDEKKFDAFTGGWGLSWDLDPFQIWHSSQADVPKGSNRVGFRNAEADQVIEKLRETFEPEERTKLHQRLHRIIHDAQAYTFLRVVKAAYCWSKEVEGVVFAKDQPITDSNPWWVTRAQ